MAQSVPPPPHGAHCYNVMGKGTWPWTEDTNLNVRIPFPHSSFALWPLLSRYCLCSLLKLIRQEVTAIKLVEITRTLEKRRFDLDPPWLIRSEYGSGADSDVDQWIWMTSNFNAWELLSREIHLCQNFHEYRITFSREMSQTVEICPIMQRSGILEKFRSGFSIAKCPKFNNIFLVQRYISGEIFIKL